MWHHRVESTPDSTAFIGRAGGTWAPITWKEAGGRVRRFAEGLLALGVSPGDRVAILSATRIEWTIADLAILCVGAVTVGIYPSSSEEEITFILNDSGCALAIADTEERAGRLGALRPQIPGVRAVVVFDASDPSPDGWRLDRRTVEERGRALSEKDPDAFDRARERIGPDDLAALIYTSGTTGRPRGVMLTHDAWVYAAEAVDRLGILNPADKQLLFLPLAHVFARMLGILGIRLGMAIVIDGDADRLLASLGETRPTWMAGVPRTFEKTREWILRAAKERGQERPFLAGLAAAEEIVRLRGAGKAPGIALRVRAALADRLLFARVRRRFGGQMRFLISGGAPLSPDVATFFHAIGLPVLEGYGLTETTAASCVSTPDEPMIGTVGRPVPGTSVRIAEDGEILIRSRGVMRGYWNDPEGTAASFEGPWFKTGDIGVLLPSGHLRITDRKKDILVTAGGKNVAPANFEGRLRDRCPLVSQVMMVGDRRPYCTALVALSEEAAGRWARARGIRFSGAADLASRPEVIAAIGAAIDEVNRQLPPFEAVRRFALLPDEPTVESGLLTPTLKLRRKAVAERYHGLLEGLYAE